MYRESEPGFDAFIVASGEVRLTRGGQLIGMRERGSINGATALIAAGDPRSATMTTYTECLVMTLTYDEFDEVLASDPELRNGMMRVLMSRLFDSYSRCRARLHFAAI